MRDKLSEQSEAINARLPREVVSMLRAAKAATGRSYKHLLMEAIRSKYSRFSNAAAS
jgi:hypothetical protein